MGNGYIDKERDEVSYTTNPPILDTKTTGLSSNCCHFINQCLIKDKQQRPSSKELLHHKWFEEDIKPIPIKDKWPWYNNINKYNEYEEDLLFMINALIIYYSSRKFDVINSVPIYSETASIQSKYHRHSDENRLANMAKYAYCTKETVLDRIRVTVSYIKSQLNKVEKM